MLIKKISKHEQKNNQWSTGYFLLPKAGFAICLWQRLPIRTISQTQNWKDIKWLLRLDILTEYSYKTVAKVT